VVPFCVHSVSIYSCHCFGLGNPLLHQLGAWI
jgi:hypothetical protein